MCRWRHYLKNKVHFSPPTHSTKKHSFFPLQWIGGKQSGISNKSFDGWGGEMTHLHTFFHHHCIHPDRYRNSCLLSPYTELVDDSHAMG